MRNSAEHAWWEIKRLLQSDSSPEDDESIAALDTDRAKEVRALVRASLQDPSAHVRTTAANVLAKLGVPLDGLSLDGVVDLSNPDVVARLDKSVLNAVNSISVERLVGIINGTDVSRLRSAAAALLLLPTESARDAVHTILAGAGREARLSFLAAVKARSPFAEEVGTHIAELAKHDPDVEIRRAAADALKDSAEYYLYEEIRAAAQREGWSQVEALVGEVAPFLPEDPQLLLFRAIARLQRGDHRGALADLNKAEEHGANSSQLLLAFAMAAGDGEDYTTAIRYASRAVEAEPSFAFARVVLGLCRYSAGLFEQAVEALEESLRLDRCSAHAAFLLGMVHIAQQQPARATGVSPRWCDRQAAVSRAGNELH